MKRRQFVTGLLATGAAHALSSCTTAIARPRRIGFLAGNFAKPVPQRPFLDKMLELGYVADRDYVVTLRSSDGHEEWLPEYARELVRLNCDVIVASGGSAQRAAIAATKTIPIVLTLGPDPVAYGFVASLARPGGNVTGVALQYVPEGPKKLELLIETAPKVTRIAVLYRSDNTSIDFANATRDAAHDRGLQAEIFGAANLEEMDIALARVEAGRFDGIIAPSLLSAVRENYEVIPNFATRHKMPQVLGDIDLVRVGGLMHYGANLDLVLAEAAVSVDRILRGTPPSELPVTVPMQRDLVINMSAAKQLGVTFPEKIRRAATAVVE